MTDTLADVLPREITRVRQVQETYKALRSMPNVNVEPQIALMERDIQAAVTACAQGDVVEMLRTLVALKGWKE